MKDRIDVTIYFAHQIMFELRDIGEENKRRILAWIEGSDQQILQIHNGDKDYRFNREYFCALTITIHPTQKGSAWI